MQSLFKRILFLVGVIAVVVMIFTFDVSFTQLWIYISRAGYWLVPILLLWAVLYAMNAWAWMTIIKGSGPATVSFSCIYQLTITGFALNYATPIGLLGGEPYRILELQKYIGVQRATSSVLLFMMMHVFSHFWFWLTAIVTYLLLVVVGDMVLDTVMSILLIMATLFCLGGVYLFLKGYRNGMVVKFIRMLSHIPGLRNWSSRFEEKHKGSLQEIDRQIAALHSQSKRSFYTSFFLEYFGRILQSFEIFFMLLLFGIDGGGTFVGLLLTFIHAFLIIAFTSLFANLLGFIPMQIGGREGGFAMSVAKMGMTAEFGIFIAVICRVRELIWASVGLFLMKLCSNDQNR